MPVEGTNEVQTMSEQQIMQQPDVPGQSQQGQTFQQQLTGQQGGPGQYFQQVAPPGIGNVVRDLAELDTVTEWAHTKAMQQGQHQVSSVLDQIAVIARTQKKLIVGQSPFAQTFSQCTSQSLQQASQQLQPYSQDPAVQDVLQELQYTAQSLQQASQQLQQWSGMGQQQGGRQYQQGGGQPIGGQQY